MSSKKIEEWLQIVGLFGVVGSLIFVGLQMKQDREIALSEIWQARSTALIEKTSSAASNEILLSAFVKSDSGRIAEITPIEQEAVSSHVSGSIYAWENSHYQYLHGFLPEEHWARVREGIKRRLQDPHQGPIMRNRTYMASFGAVVEEIDRELTAEKN